MAIARNHCVERIYQLQTFIERNEILKRGKRRNEIYKSRLLNGVIESSIVDRRSLIIDVGSRKNRIMERLLDLRRFKREK